MLTPDWLVEDEDTRRFYGLCQSYCEAGCCGSDAFGNPLDPASRLSRQEISEGLASIDLCRARRRSRAVIMSLVSVEAPIQSSYFNDTWRSGGEAAEWFAGYVVILEQLLGEREYADDASVAGDP